MRVFTRICEVEGGIHGMSVDEVHLHEVGGVDAIVDVVGVLAAVELLGIERVVVSPLPMGRGFINGAHGQIPLPAPATLGLLKGVPVVRLAHRQGTRHAHRRGAVSRTGRCLGPDARDDPARSRLRRRHPRPGDPERAAVLMLGDSSSDGPWLSETITVLETHLDNDRGETIGHAFQR